jgi:reversibly glycosylated polypeptide/UDP-arabinopyranose mutase
MNLAFKTKISPLMYFPLMGYNDKNLHWGYDRFDDIWAGVFAKKIIDHLDLAVVNGSPFVEHKKASNVFTNLLKEAKGIQTNEILYQNVDKVTLTSKTIVGSYKELIAKLELPKEDYFIKLKKAIEIWLNLY